jgi:hypothetical protein
MKFETTVYDAAEGRLHITVEAHTEDEADEEAYIAASERGCRHITEIVVDRLNPKSGVWPVRLT